MAVADAWRNVPGVPRRRWTLAGRLACWAGLVACVSVVAAPGPAEDPRLPIDPADFKMPPRTGTATGRTATGWPHGPHETRRDVRLAIPRERGLRTGRSATVVRGPWHSVQVNVDAAGRNIIDDAANEPSLAIDPANPNRLVIGWRQFDTILSDFRQAGWGYSDDGGQTWTFPGSVDPGVFRSDPVVDADANGAFYYFSLHLDEAENYTCQLFKSLDGGLTWGPPMPAFGGDKNWMVIDRTTGSGRGHIYGIWQRFYNCCENRTFTRSANAGHTFIEPVYVPSSPTFGTMAVGPDGEVYAAGIEAIDFQNGNVFVVAKSVDAKNPLLTPTFTTTQVDLGGSQVFGEGPNPGGLLGQVYVAVDTSSGPRRGYVYVLGTVRPPAGDALDIMFARSTNGGETWDPPVRVNKDPLSYTAWQWFGTMSVAPNGRIDVFWNDTRHDPTVTYSELYYSYSHDGGVTWSADIPVTPPFNHCLGYPRQNKIGDYYQSVSETAEVALAYAATFNGEQDVFFLRAGDCNGNGVHDGLDIASGASDDCTANGVPDECEPDCNGNGVADSCDLAFGASPDCTGNGIPDECEPDCNSNGSIDSCELAAGSGPDCNSNGVPDECDISGATSADCNGDQSPDECDIAAASSLDCQLNGVPDECELDRDGDGLPDGCRPLEVVGQWGGTCFAVAASGNRACIGVGQRLIVLDVTTPAAPTALGQTDLLPGFVNGIAMVGDLAFLSCGSGGLQVVDVSNPQRPVRLGGGVALAEAQGVAVVGSYAYVAGGSSGLQVVDVSDPANPILRGSLDTSGYSVSVAVAGGYAFVADHSAGLQVVNVSNPLAPAPVATLDTPGSAYDVVIVGNYAYVADFSAGLQVLNVSTPTAPVRVGGVDTSGYAYSLAVSGRWAYVADGNKLQVIDVLNPLAPVLAGAAPTTGQAGAVALSAGRAYVADGDNLQVIDVCSPTNPVRIGGYDTGGYAYDVAVADSRAYVADGGLGGFRILDVTEPAHPVRLGALDGGSFANATVVVGSLAYLANGDNFLLVDVSNPSAPVTVGGYDNAGWARTVSAAGHYAYVAAYDAGLLVIDVSTPTAPVLVGAYAPSGLFVLDVAVGGDLAYLAVGGFGLEIVDVSSPAAPTHLGACDTPGSSYAVTVSGTHAYLADGTAGLQVIDVSNPSAPVRVGHLTTPGFAYEVATWGRFLALADATGGVLIADLSDPAAPKRVGGMVTGGLAYAVSVVGRYVYVADQADGLVILGFGRGGDANGDTVVDARDFALLADCLAGPDAAPQPPPPFIAENCLNAFDFDLDNDVDLVDFAAFLAVFNPHLPGDYDGDGNIDSDDYRTLADCLFGPGAPPVPLPPTSASGCLRAFDFDADGDVDLIDFAAFVGIFTRP